jgi:predicted molibdopterin-dependent oxidoreductase YjgC
MPNGLTRLTEPMVREDGELRVATWEEALDRAAEGLRAATELLEGHERDELRGAEVHPPGPGQQQHRQL